MAGSDRSELEARVAERPRSPLPGGQGAGAGAPSAGRRVRGMARTPGPAPPYPGGGKAQLSSVSAPGAQLFPLPPPLLLLLLFPLFFFSRFCGALAGPIVVEPYVTAVWGKNVSLKCIIEVKGTIIQVSWEKIQGKRSQTVSVHHPQYGFAVQEAYQGRVLFKNHSINDATIVLRNIDFSDSGEYICKAVTFPLGNVQSSTTVTVLVEPTVSLKKGPYPLIDGGNETVAAICTAATGKPVAQIDWEGDLGEMESTVTSFPNETVTIVSQYKLIPTKFARGRRITCVVRHPALEKEIRYSFMLDIQCALAGPIVVEPYVTAVWGKNVSLKCIIEVNGSITQVSWEKIQGKSSQTVSVHHPQYGFAVQEAYQGRVLFKNHSLNDATIVLRNIDFSDSGEYICKAVTFPLGNVQSSTTVTVLGPPTNTTLPPTVQWCFSTVEFEDVDAPPKKLPFPLSTLATIKDGTIGTIIGGTVGGSLFLILVSVLVGIFFYRRRRTFRGDYFVKNYIPPSDMQKESQIDVLHQDELDSYPDSVKKENKHPVNNLISKEYLEEPDKSQWNNVDNLKRFERLMDYYEDIKMGMKFVGDESFDDNEDDLVSHVDGSVISRREWYV